MKPVVLLDTNVWVSALLNPTGAPSRLIAAWLDGKFEVISTLPILDEIAEVLRRPRLKRKYAITQVEISEYLHLIAARTVLVSVIGRLAICRDPDDDHILEAAIVGGAQIVVTRDDDLKGDQEVLRQMREHRVEIMTISHFLATLVGRLPED